MATAYAHAPEPPPLPLEIADYKRASITADEFLELEGNGVFRNRKVELVNGELWEEALPGWTHSRLQMYVGILLASVVDRNAVVVVGELSVRMSESTVRDFDCGLTVPRLGDVRAVAPAQVVLAIEIAVTTLPGGLNIKAREYAAAGIPAYWVVDAASEVVHAMRGPGPNGYAERAQVGFAEPLEVPGGGTIVLAE